MTIRQLIEQLLTIDNIDEEIYVATAESDGKEISHIAKEPHATFIIIG